MKYRDTKRLRNYRVVRQKLREWKVQRNIIGKPTGAFDVNGNEIKIGDKVKVKDYWDAIVLYSDLGYVPQKYPLLLRAFDNEGDKDIYHPDNYGKWEGDVPPTYHQTLRILESPCTSKCW